MDTKSYLRPVSKAAHAKRSVLLDPSRQRRGSNWIHESLAVAESRSGLGVVALNPIPAGTLVVMYGGTVITASQFEELSNEMQNFPFQVSDDLFLGPRDETDLGVGERINHSCDPNVGFAGAIALVALRDIRAGEEITLDYATCVASHDDAFVMQCACGAPSCRKIVTGHDWKLQGVQDRLLDHYQPFLQEKVKALRGDDSSAERFQLTKAQNDDTPQSPLIPLMILRTLLNVPRKVVKFMRESLEHEWMAIPICIIAGFPSTLATTGIMALLTSWIRGLDFAQGEAAFISTISLLSSIVGYSTYLIAYYSGMMWKERSDWMVDGRVSRQGLRRKLKVIQYDFVAHLPSDFWVMPLIGAATGGFFVAGMSQFWSIVVANTLADVTYAIKEPFFWHGAKKLVAWREEQAGLSAPTELDRTAV